MLANQLDFCVLTPTPICFEDNQKKCTLLAGFGLGFLLLLLFLFFLNGVFGNLVLVTHKMK